MPTPEDTSAARPGSEHLYDALVEAGIDILVGIPGTQTLPLDRTVAQRDEMRYVMARHETAVPHVAWGYYEAGGGMAATLTVPGPGDTNAMHGLKNALDDCVPIVHVSPDVDPAERGKGPIHEIEPDTYDNVVKENVNVERPVEFLERVRSGLEAAQTPPYGPVRLGVPDTLLEADIRPPDVNPQRSQEQFDGDSAYATAIDELASAERPVVYVGGGARRSSGSIPAIRDLAERLDAPVISSYKGKGVFPEDEPRFMGVTGSHLPAGARQALDASDAVVALGTDFDGVTTANWSVPLGETLVHVNLDTDDIDAAYEADAAIVDDVATAVERLHDGLEGRSRPDDAWSGDAVGAEVQAEYVDHLRQEGLLGNASPINTPAALRALREELPREAVVTTDIGGFRLWAKQMFEAYTPETYVTAGSWAGMGVGLPAAIGAQLAVPDRPVVSITGDGGLMMCLQELHTAADEGLDVITIVFNNADYGVISKSPKIEQYTEDHQFDWSTPDFEAIAEGFDCRGQTVRTLPDLREAVNTALTRDSGPELIDVRVDPNETTAAAAAEYESDLSF